MVICYRTLYREKDKLTWVMSEAWTNLWKLGSAHCRDQSHRYSQFQFPSVLSAAFQPKQAQSQQDHKIALQLNVCLKHQAA